MKNLTIKELYKLKYSWSAEVILKNDQLISIWYTALPMSETTIKKVVSVASDYPQHKVNKELI